KEQGHSAECRRLAGYVGGSDVAAAAAADVLAAEDADEEIAEGDGAQQVTGGGDLEESWHGFKRRRVLFPARGAGGAPPLQPASRRRYFKSALLQVESCQLC